MLVKIVQPGWEKFNDVMYGVTFTDGVSNTDLRLDQALQLGAMMSVVEIAEDGTVLGPVSPTFNMVQTHAIAAEVVEPMKSDAEVPVLAEPAKPTVAPDDEAPEQPTPAATRKAYTEAELQEIADSKGIAGLREIGEPLNVKNTAIRGLIREILAAQNGE